MYMGPGKILEVNHTPTALLGMAKRSATANPAGVIK
jgi:hypothetical protein